MTVLDKIKAFFKWCGEGIMGFLEAKPEAETKVAEAPGKKVDESSSK